LITMALLEPGWESHFELVPKISKIVCIGQIVSHTPTGDGRHNILLAGIRRARIIEEFSDDVPFRKARVEIIEDQPMSDPAAEEAARLELLQRFRPALPEELAGSQSFNDLLSQHIPLGSLTDVIAYALNFPSAIKQSLLGQPSVEIRYKILVDQLSLIASSKQSKLEYDRPIRTTGGQAPPFSIN
jgi:Lon protease-like protein